jgi:hypothetical protein
VVSHLSKTIEAIVGITFFLRSRVSVTFNATSARPVAGGSGISVTDQAILASKTGVAIVLNVFTAALVTVFVTKVSEETVAFVTRLDIFNGIPCFKMIACLVFLEYH